MYFVLRCKFSQHKDLATELLSTGDDELIEVGSNPVCTVIDVVDLSFSRLQDSPGDFFWGCGRDGTGRNELGKQLEKLREQLCVYG